jgi:hypothetical protein
LEDDPIKKVDKLAHLMGHLSRAVTPRVSHERIPLHVSLSTSVQAYVVGSEVEMQIRNSSFAMIGIITGRSSSHLFANRENASLIESLGIKSSSTDSLLSTIAIDLFQFQI